MQFGGNAYGLGDFSILSITEPVQILDEVNYYPPVSTYYTLSFTNSSTTPMEYFSVNFNVGEEDNGTINYSSTASSQTWTFDNWGVGSRYLLSTSTDPEFAVAEAHFTIQRID